MIFKGLRQALASRLYYIHNLRKKISPADQGISPVEKKLNI
jgi:hypothetical protein